ncbi:Uncharacterised protein [Mycobacteroides abscessus subsp. bolletii]|nr:Uncharacterised protein [Mycobacteroides abscessus subsp. bolletii]
MLIGNRSPWWAWNSNLLSESNNAGASDSVTVQPGCSSSFAFSGGSASVMSMCVVWSLPLPFDHDFISANASPAELRGHTMGSM